jgi:hypothetical protein
VFFLTKYCKIFFFVESGEHTNATSYNFIGTSFKLLYLDKVDINSILFEEGTPLKPFMQLLCVLPQQSNYLLPSKLKNLMTNPKLFPEFLL